MLVGYRTRKVVGGSSLSRRWLTTLGGGFPIYFFPFAHPQSLRYSLEVR